MVVQGGTFYNDAVLRSFEKISGCEAVRPDIAGIMGAYGAARLPVSATMLQDNHDAADRQDLKPDLQDDDGALPGCTNHCVLTINRFDGGRQFVTGNRCERGPGGNKQKKTFRTYLTINTTVCSIMNR